MKLIAHRGNITGPDPLRENSLEYIDAAIELGYDVEIDIRHDPVEQKFYLGHDDPQYQVSMLWIFLRKDKLWIHTKDSSSLEVLSTSEVDFNYFWHETDKHTLTSKGFIWSYPGQPHSSNSVIVMPENSDITKFRESDEVDMSNYDCYAVCSDYVGKIK